MFINDALAWASYRLWAATFLPVISLFDALFDMWVEQAEQAAEEYMMDHNL